MEGKAPALADGRAMQQFSEDVRSRPEADIGQAAGGPVRLPLLPPYGLLPAQR